MGKKPKKRKSPMRDHSPWPSVELFLALVLVTQMSSLVHQVR
jgi:hypothetical protein